MIYEAYKISPNELIEIQHAICVCARRFLPREGVPEAKGFIASSRDDSLSFGTHGQVEDTVGVSSEGRHHTQRRVLPYADLVLCRSGGEPMSRYELMRGDAPHKVTNLARPLATFPQEEEIQITWLPVSS